MEKVVAAASFIAAAMQVKYEKYDWFLPRRLGPLRGHCQPQAATLDCCFVRVLGFCSRRVIQGTDEFRRVAG
jgi:hypothetical protein